MKHTFAGVLSGAKPELVLAGKYWTSSGREGLHTIMDSTPASVRLVLHNNSIVVEVKTGSSWALFRDFTLAEWYRHYENGMLLLVPGWSDEPSVSFNEPDQVMTWLDQWVEEGQLS